MKNDTDEDEMVNTNGDEMVNTNEKISGKRRKRKIGINNQEMNRKKERNNPQEKTLKKEERIC